MNESLSKNEEEFFKKEYSKYFLLVRRIINELDPVGLIGMGEPEDEHDTLTAEVLLLIVNGRMNDLRQVIIDSYERYGFGVEKVAEEFKD